MSLLHGRILSPNGDYVITNHTKNPSSLRSTTIRFIEDFSEFIWNLSEISFRKTSHGYG
jgi:hypothetical protein